MRARSWLLVCAAVGIACGTESPEAQPAPTPSDAASDAPAPSSDLGDVLGPARTASGLPGVAAIVLRHGAVVAEGASGVRREGTADVVTTNDAWQLGSAVQAMTAALAGAVVRKGKLSWKTTVAEAGLAAHPDHAATSLETLLAQRSGLSSTLPGDVEQALRATSARSAREVAAGKLLAAPAEAPAGTAYRPTDAAYLVASAMIEKAMDRAFEDLVNEEVFVPLGMASCRTRVDDPASVPWSHVREESGALRPVAPDEDAPAAAAPARGMRCTLRDWVKLGGAHLAAARGEAVPFLDRETFEALQRPVDGFHALGLDVVSRPWTGDRPAFVSASRGAAAMALGWIAPSPDVVFLVVANRGDSAAVQAVDRLVGELVARFVVNR